MFNEFTITRKWMEIAKPIILRVAKEKGLLPEVKRFFQPYQKSAPYRFEELIRNTSVGCYVKVHDFLADHDMTDHYPIVTWKKDKTYPLKMVMKSDIHFLHFMTISILSSNRHLRLELVDEISKGIMKKRRKRDIIKEKYYKLICRL